MTPDIINADAHTYKTNASLRSQAAASARPVLDADAYQIEKLAIRARPQPEIIEA